MRDREKWREKWAAKKKENPHSIYSYFPKYFFTQRSTMHVGAHGLGILYERECGRISTTMQKKLMADVHWKILRRVIDGKIYRLPGLKGYLMVKKSKKPLPLLNDRVNMKVFPNLHSDGCSFLHKWYRSRYYGGKIVARFRNQSIYNLVITRDKKYKMIGRDGLAAEIDRRKNDPYSKCYSALKALPMVIR